MEVMLEKKLPLSELLKDMKIYPQVLKNVRVRDKKEAREDAEVQAAVKAGEAKLNGDGRILLRESGTEPLIRVMAEASTMELCNEVVDDIVAVLQKFVQK
jgi:phosphoglucosamine mutase